MQDDDFSLFRSETRGVKPLKHEHADVGKPKTDRKCWPACVSRRLCAPIR